MSDEPKREVSAYEFINRIRDIVIVLRDNPAAMSQDMHAFAVVKIDGERTTFSVSEMFPNILLRQSLLGSRGVKRELVARFAKLLDDIELRMQEEAGP